MTPTFNQIRSWAEKHNLSALVLITIGAWLGVTFIFAYFFVSNVLATEEVYGYERSRLLISTAFIADTLPFFLIALTIAIVLEVLVVLNFVARGGPS